MLSDDGQNRRHYRLWDKRRYSWDVRCTRKVVRLIFKWINRRNQKLSCYWEKIIDFIWYNLLPKPRIYHSFYTRSRNGKVVSRSPGYRNQQVLLFEKR